MSSPVLECQDLYGGYGGKDVLRGVGFDLGAGELVAVLGPNGAGKTTLLRTITGAMRPRCGTVRVKGRALEGMSHRDRACAVALAPQLVEVPFSFRVEDFALLGRRPHLSRFSAPGARDREAVADALERSGLSGLADRPLHALSGGERQRAVLAQALVQEPDLLLLDEPATHLDVNHQVEVFERLTEIAASGTAVLTVLHDLNLAAEYAKRVLLFHRGELVADGPPYEVLDGARVAAVFGIRLRVEQSAEGGKPFIRYRRAP